MLQETSQNRFVAQTGNFQKLTSDHSSAINHKITNFQPIEETIPHKNITLIGGTFDGNYVTQGYGGAIYSGGSSYKVYINGTEVGDILVPYPPESKLSGGTAPLPGDQMTYEREFTLPEGFDDTAVSLCINYPTRSAVRAEQAAGRAIRLNESDPHKIAFVIDTIFRKHDSETSDTALQTARHAKQVLFTIK